MWGGGGGSKCFHPKNGADERERFYPVLRGGGGWAKTILDPWFSHFVAPLHVIKDQSLIEIHPNLVQVPDKYYGKSNMGITYCTIRGL